MRDVTEQVEAQQLLEQRVEERTRELNMLLDVSHSLTAMLDLDSVLNFILDRLRELFDSHSAAIFHLDRRRQQINMLSFRSRNPNLPTVQPYRLLPDSIEQLVIGEGQVHIIPDVVDSSADARRWQARYEALYGPVPTRVRSWMAVPMRLRGQPIGMLTFAHPQPAFYTPHRAQLALALASQAAVAIENARLYQEAQTLAALQERQKLARELHDSVSQALYGIALATRTGLKLIETDSAEKEALARPLEYTLSLADVALAEMRALIFDLRPESLEVEGLLPALERRLEALRARHQLEIRFSPGEEPAVPLPVKEALYRVAQEALQNVVKHAGASRVEISLTVTNGELLLEIRDDGQGFDTTGHFPGHLGLHSMRERVEGVRGRFHLESTPGHGTRILAALPV